MELLTSRISVLAFTLWTSPKRSGQPRKEGPKEKESLGAAKDVAFRRRARQVAGAPRRTGPSHLFGYQSRPSTALDLDLSLTLGQKCRCQAARHGLCVLALLWQLPAAGQAQAARLIGVHGVEAHDIAA